MTDDADRFLHIAPSDLAVGINARGTITLDLGKPHPSLGFDPTIRFGAELSPSEARQLGDLLVRKAREAEGGSSEH